MNNKPLVRNASDEEQVKDARIKVQLGRDQEINDLKFILAAEQGRRFLWRTLEICGVYRSSFTGSSETYFLEGQRNIGLKLLAEITDIDPDSYLKMIKENKGVQ